MGNSRLDHAAEQEDSLYATTTTSTSIDDLKPHPTHSYPASHHPGPLHSDLKTIDEYDIAPIDQPPEIQAITDREPFQVLARHISGISQAGDGPALDPPPDGGWEAWGVVMGAWFVLFVGFGIITSFGQFAEYYIVSHKCLLPVHNISTGSAGADERLQRSIEQPTCKPHSI